MNTNELQDGKGAGFPLSDGLGGEKAGLVGTVKMFDGWPYGEITIEPAYKERCSEHELLLEIIAAMKRWLNIEPKPCSPDDNG
jgi:hypothetical protein